MTSLVLLHPFPLDASSWDPVRAIMAVDRPVIAPSFPGFGGTDPLPGVGIADFADQVAEVIRREAGGRAAVAGLSMGGYTALALAARHPETIAALVLADTRAEADTDAAREARDQAVVTVRAAGLGAFLDDFLPRLLAPDATDAVRERARRIADRQPGDAVIAALTALRERPDRRGDLAAITAPTLVVVGEHDAVTPLAAAEVLVQGIPGAQLEIVPEAGHLTALERPESFAALLRAHLAAADL